MKAIALATASFAAAFSMASAATEQVHLGFVGEAGAMGVSWVTKSSCSTATVKYGTSKTNLSSSATAKTSLFTTGMTTPICVYNAIMTGLRPETKYYYRAGESTAPVYSFTAPMRTGQGKASGKPTVYGVLADFGMTNDISLNELLDEAEAGTFDVVLHSGDLAYDLDNDGGARGNDFMNALQPMTSAMPYVTTLGNHEHALNFTHFAARFPGNSVLSKNSGSSNQFWYSFDHGLVHIATIDTELYFYCYEANSAAYCKRMISDQLAWLQQDLSSVDRSVTPWVIVMGHKQGLWMDSIGQSNWTYIETILQANHVDLYLTGHTHNYARTLPNNKGKVEQCCTSDARVCKDCSTMISLVVGSPGCKEGISSLSPPTEVVAKQILQYGYGHITVYNRTHLQWQWEQTGTATARRKALADAKGLPYEGRVLLRGSKIIADVPLETVKYDEDEEKTAETVTPRKKPSSRTGGSTKKKSGSGSGTHKRKPSSGGGSSGDSSAPVEDQFWLIKSA